MRPHGQRLTSLGEFKIRYLALLVLCSLAFGCSEKRQTFTPNSSPIESQTNAININTAPAYELEKLPGIGLKTAKEIIRHRRTFGRFRRVEHILLVKGLSDGRFRRIRYMVKIK